MLNTVLKCHVLLLLSHFSEIFTLGRNAKLPIDSKLDLEIQKSEGVILLDQIFISFSICFWSGEVKFTGLIEFNRVGENERQFQVGQPCSDFFPRHDVTSIRKNHESARRAAECTTVPYQTSFTLTSHPCTTFLANTKFGASSQHHPHNTNP